MERCEARRGSQLGAAKYMLAGARDVLIYPDLPRVRGGLIIAKRKTTAGTTAGADDGGSEE